MGGDLAAHQMAGGILDQRQLVGARARRGDGDKGFGQQRMHLAPLGIPGQLGAKVCGDHDVQCTRVQLIQQPVAGPGFQQEPAAPQVLCQT